MEGSYIIYCYMKGMERILNSKLFIFSKYCRNGKDSNGKDMEFYCEFCD